MVKDINFRANPFIRVIILNVSAELSTATSLIDNDLRGDQGEDIEN